MNIKTEISIGEFLDKLSILEIKRERIPDKTRLKNIQKELSLLQEQWGSLGISTIEISELRNQLKKVNERLWEIEDKIREKEKLKIYDNEFIELARSVYFTNDRRSEIKKIINLTAGSDLIEEKSYTDYK